MMTIHCRTLVLALSLIFVSAELASGQSGDRGKHLFILSGQSNMAGLDPDLSFKPTVEAAFGAENVLLVKVAQGGQPIRRWYQDWQWPENSNAKPKSDKPQKSHGDLYDKLMGEVRAAVGDQAVQSVTFVWMQGERDAREKNAAVYADAFQGVLQQIQKDLGRDDVYFVIGRLSDFDMANRRYAHWTQIREIQVALADGSDRGAWVDTDDLNDGKNRRGMDIKDDLHYSVSGYKTLGKRFADEAIKLIQTSNANSAKARDQ